MVVNGRNTLPKRRDRESWILTIREPKLAYTEDRRVCPDLYLILG